MKTRLSNLIAVARRIAAKRAITSGMFAARGGVAHALVGATPSMLAFAKVARLFSILRSHPEAAFERTAHYGQKQQWYAAHQHPGATLKVAGGYP